MNELTDTTLGAYMQRFGAKVNENLEVVFDSTAALHHMVFQITQDHEGRMLDHAVSDRNRAKELLEQLAVHQACDVLMRDSLKVIADWHVQTGQLPADIVDLVESALQMPADSRALQVVLHNLGDIVEDIRRFNTLAGNTDDRYNARQLAMYTGLQLEEVAEKLSHLGLNTEAPALDKLGTEFKTGVYDELFTQADPHDLLDDDVDLGVVTIGALFSQGVDIHGAFAEVSRANMAKVFPDGTLHKNDQGKIEKPDGWVPPELTPYLAKVAVAP